MADIIHCAAIRCDQYGVYGHGVWVGPWEIWANLCQKHLTEITRTDAPDVTSEPWFTVGYDAIMDLVDNAGKDGVMIREMLDVVAEAISVSCGAKDRDDRAQVTLAAMLTDGAVVQRDHAWVVAKGQEPQRASGFSPRPRAVSSFRRR